MTDDEMEIARKLGKVSVAFLANALDQKNGEQVATVVNQASDKLFDTFLKRGVAVEDGAYAGCQSVYDRVERTVEIAAFGAKVINDLNPPAPTLGDIGRSIGELGNEIGRSLKDFSAEHPVTTAVGVGVVTGGAAYLAAGPIAAAAGANSLLGAASTGTPICTLKGAALTSASLAKLGGGSILAGGAGMTGGTVVVASTGGAVGSSVAFSLTPDMNADEESGNTSPK